ncbi:MAG: septation regulator SpoVG [Candidatus Zixiibacteriota bacterium]
MEITEVRITLRDEAKLKAFVNVTFDNSFVIRGLKVINGTKGYFVSMPSRKRQNGTHQDIAHPINNEMRRMIEDKVLAAYENELKNKEAGGDAEEMPPDETPPDETPPEETPEDSDIIE